MKKMAEKVCFEKNIQRLEEIVKSLEHGDVPLEDSLVLFEEGTQLIKKCNTMLDKAQQKITLLTKDKEGNMVEEVFEPENL